MYRGAGEGSIKKVLSETHWSGTRVRGAGLEKLGILGIQDTRQFAFSLTNEAGPEAQLGRRQNSVKCISVTDR